MFQNRFEKIAQR